jgi:hypothetical protein
VTLHQQILRLIFIGRHTADEREVAHFAYLSWEESRSEAPSLFQPTIANLKLTMELNKQFRLPVVPWDRNIRG